MKALSNLGSLGNVWQPTVDALVEAAGAQQSWIDQVGPAGGGKNVDSLWNAQHRKRNTEVKSGAKLKKFQRG
jgi:hypothetical protein